MYVRIHTYRLTGRTGVTLNAPAITMAGGIIKVLGKRAIKALASVLFDR